MKSFICGCGVQYDYIQLKYLMYFSMSFNLIMLKKEIMRFMYEIIKSKCCKCKKPVEVLIKDNIQMIGMELYDQEAEKIFNIHKFNHLICENCDKTKEITKKKFFCNLGLSEHSFIKNVDSNNIQAKNTCSIF